MRRLWFVKYFGGMDMKHVFNRITTVLLFISSLMLACSLTLPATSSPETEYRYDNLPDKANESQAVSEYRAISKWDTLDITYFRRVDRFHSQRNM